MIESRFDPRAGAGVRDPDLVRLLEDHWEATVRRHPTWASRMGDRRFDGLLPGTRPEDHEAAHREEAAFLDRARRLDAGSLGEPDALTLALFIDTLEAGLKVASFRMEEWSLSPRANPVAMLGWLPLIRPLKTPEDGASLLARYCAMPDFVAGELEGLRRGVAGSRLANAETARRVVELTRGELAKPTAEWAAVSQAQFAEGAWTDADAEAFRDECSAVVDEFVRPAFEAYAAFIETGILPHAREGDHVGLTGIPDGAACYEALIRSHTSLGLSASEIHETGRRELEKIHAEFAEVGGRVFGTRDVAEIFTRLRTDKALHFETADQVQEKAESALAAAIAAAPDWFGRLPKAECVVKPVPEHEAPYTTIAYYRPAAPDGSSPGEYRVNTYAPETRPRHEAEVLAFHEAVPGHHTQICIAQELGDLPAFRRHAGMTAYVEGWALYTERLADEMGLYSGDTDRLGMLSFDAWRASRLVVDTGVHAMGWSRERAIGFMEEWTPLALNNIDNEVDRYVSWPGQALSYKLGQIEMWRLRRLAEERLGEGFDIKAFHDEVLGAGALPLPVLADRIERWVGACSQG